MISLLLFIPIISLNKPILLTVYHLIFVSNQLNFLYLILINKNNPNRIIHTKSIYLTLNLVLNLFTAKNIPTLNVYSQVIIFAYKFNYFSKPKIIKTIKTYLNLIKLNNHFLSFTKAQM